MNYNMIIHKNHNETQKMTHPGNPIKCLKEELRLCKLSSSGMIWDKLFQTNFGLKMGRLNSFTLNHFEFE